MSEQPITAKDIQDQLRDITEMAEHGDVKLSPEVSEYLHQWMDVILRKLEKRIDVSKKDMRFLENVKTWMKMPEKLRISNSDINEMIKPEKIEFEKRKCLTLQQWEDLLNMAEILESEGAREWIDENCTFRNGIIEITKNLYLNDTSITSLPEGLHVEGNLDLRNTPITSLPEGLHVGGYLDLKNTPIKSLPSGLKVGRDLSLQDTPIESLPNDINIKTDLRLDNTPISKLPKRLTVGENLYLRNTQITSLPADLRVGKNVWLWREDLVGQLKKDIASLKKKGRIANVVISE